jgi:hypothetical protein
MKLADFLFYTNRLPRDTLVAIDGLKPNTLTLYLRSKRVPNATMMAKIEKYTYGLVTRTDFLDPTPPKCVTIVDMPDGRERHVYPWTVNEKALRLAAELEANRDPHERPAEHPLQHAFAILGCRVVDTGREGIFLLDCGITDARGIVRAANLELRMRGLPLIHYPGVLTRWRS